MTTETVETQGFEAPTTHLELVFKDPSFEGLRVNCSAPSLGLLGRTLDLIHVDPDNPSEADIADAMAIAEEFTDHLESWNLIDRKTKEPVPPTVGGLHTLDLVFVMQILGAWMDAVSRVVKNYDQTVEDQVNEAAIPMTTME